MSTATKKRCTCIECGISFGIRPPGTFSPVTCEECTSKLEPRLLCAKCGRIIARGECYVPTCICSVCASDWLREAEIEAWNDYVESDGDNEHGRFSGLYENLREKLQSRNWIECISLARCIPVLLEVAR